MKINLNEKYQNNLENKYKDFTFDCLADMPKKEVDMWQFTYYILKDNYPKVVFDTVSQRDYLEGCLEIYLCMKGITPFTYEEWVAYMASK